MGIENILQPKTDAEIEHLLKILPAEQIIEMGANMKDVNLIKFGIEKTCTKIWAKDYNSSSASFFDNMINLKTIYEISQISTEEKRGLIIVKNLMRGNEDEYYLNFFVSIFSPIYKDNEHIKIMSGVIDKIHAAFK